MCLGACLYSSLLCTRLDATVSVAFARQIERGESEGERKRKEGEREGEREKERRREGGREGERNMEAVSCHTVKEGEVCWSPGVSCRIWKHSQTDI